MKNRLISMTLALLLLLGMLCACGGGKSGTETTTAAGTSATTTVTELTTTAVQTDAGGNVVEGELDENGYLKDSLPADLNYGGETVTF